MLDKYKIYSFPDFKKARIKIDAPFSRRNYEKGEENLVLLKGKKVYIRTYGCQANIRDEEIMLGILKEFGMEETNIKEEADLVILNTCAVRENAEEKVYGEIGSFKPIKKYRPQMKIALCGCMALEPPIVEKVLNTYPHIDFMFGTHDIFKLPIFLKRVFIDNEKFVDILSSSGEVIENLPSTRKEKFKAFVNIMYGCDKFCSYCIVPSTRGRERSRALKDVLRECEQLVKDGYLDITLLGQNVNAYGKDLKDGTNFTMLLEEVAKSGVKRLRFITSHPFDFDDDLIDVIAKYDNIMKYIHLPVQSGSSKVLKAMNRRYDREGYLSLVRKIKERIPNVALSSDIIVGFPGESEEDFLDTLSLVEEVQYASLFTFIYSPRPFTPATIMKDQIDDKIKHERFMRLSKTSEKIIERLAKEMVGKTYDVLIEEVSKKDPHFVSGYTEEFKLVHVAGDASLIGKIIKVKITESHTYSLIGERVDG